MVENLIKRILINLFPEIYSQSFAPKEAVIVNVGRLSKAAVLDDEFLPSYAVDVRILNDKGEIDELVPVLESLPLPLNHGGGESGFYGTPKEGLKVVVHFINGSPHKPYIQTILSTGSVVPGLKRGEMVWSKGEGIEQRLDSAGNWTRETTQDISERCDTYNTTARELNETIGKRTSLIKGRWLSTCYGYMKHKVMGSISFVSGGRFNITAAETLNMTALNDLNLNTAKKHNSHSKEDMTLATDKDLLIKCGSTLHVGNDTVNLVQIVSDLAAEVEKIATFAGEQLYGGVGSALVPANPATTAATDTGKIKTSVDGLLSAED